MFARLSEIVHEWLGWCPNAQPHTRWGTREQVGMSFSSSQRGPSKARAIDWLGLFRNQMFLLAGSGELMMTLVKTIQHYPGECPQGSRRKTRMFSATEPDLPAGDLRRGQLR